MSESPGVFDLLIMLVMAVWPVCQFVVCFLKVPIGAFEVGEDLSAVITSHESRRQEAC